MKVGKSSGRWRPVMGALIVGVFACSLTLQGATPSGSRSTALSGATPKAILAGRPVPVERIPIAPPVYARISRLLLIEEGADMLSISTGAEPGAFGSVATGGPTGCELDVECDDCNPCTDDECVAEVCVHTDTGQCNPCDDEFFCNGTDKCDGAGTCVTPAGIKQSVCNNGLREGDYCQKGDSDCHECVGGDRPEEKCCPGGGLCTAGTCVGGDRDTLECCPNGTCDQTGTCKLQVLPPDPCASFPSMICDEEALSGSTGETGKCVGQATGPGPGGGVGQWCLVDGDCDDEKACNGGEICLKASQTLGPGNGGECVGGTTPGLLCATDAECGVGGQCAGVCRPDPANPRPCGQGATCDEPAGPGNCGPGRCCQASGNDFICARATRPDCLNAGGHWLGVGDLPSTTEDDADSCPPNGCCLREADSTFPNPGEDFGCPKYSSGITDGNVVDTFGPAGTATCRPYWEIGDDYTLENCPKGSWLELHTFRYVGGPDRDAGSRMRVTFYDSQGRFIEDAITDPTFPGGIALRTQVFGEKPIIPCQGIVTLKPAIRFSPNNRSRWMTTDDCSSGDCFAGANDIAHVYIRMHGFCQGDPTIGCNDDADCAAAAPCVIDPEAKQAPLEQVAFADVGLTSGVLAFEIVGDKVPEPLRACCERDTGNCTLKLPWVCEQEGNAVQDVSSCNICSNNPVQGCNSDPDCYVCAGGDNDGSPCGCPGGTCDGTVCQGGSRDQQPCDCPNGVCDSTSTCFPVPPACQVSACCDKTTGDCSTVTGGFCTGDGTTPCFSTDECTGVGGPGGVCQAPCPGGSNSLGFGTDCDPDCCDQPGVNATAGDTCAEADIVVINVPPIGSPPVRLTFSGDNKPATFGDYGDPNISGDGTCEFGIFNPDGGTRDRGWWHAFSIDACANVRLDLCCTAERSGEIHQPQWAFISTDCNPCTSTRGNEIVGTGGTVPNIGTDTDANDRGEPFCDSDDLWQTFRHLPKGIYYHPIYTAPGGHFGEYQLHMTVGPCQIAACCLPEARCVDNATGYIGDPCQSDLDCTVGTCDVCAEAIAPTCDDVGGFWNGFRNIPLGDPPVDTCQFGACDLGSCCTSPGVCQDAANPDIQPCDRNTPETCMDRTLCDVLNGTYVGGAMCDYPKNPCPACEIEGETNCQLLDLSEHVPLTADLSITPSGVTHADDFIPSVSQINNICVWGTYLDGSEQLTGRVGCTGAVEDDFRIRIYADGGGTPGTLIAQVDNHPDAGDAIFPPCPLANCPGPVTVVKSEIAESGFFNVYGDNGADQVQVFNLSFPTIDLPAAGVTYWLEVANNTHTLAGGTEPTRNRCNWHWMQVYYQDTVGNDYAAVGTNDVEGQGAGSGYLGWRSASWTDTAFCLGGPTGPVPFTVQDEPTGACCRCDGTCEDGVTLHDCAHDHAVWGGWESTCADAGMCDPPLTPGNDCGAPPPLGGVATGVDCTPPQPVAGEVIPISDGTFATNTACATTDGPPNPTSASDNFLGHDVWFAYTATCTGKLWTTQCAHTSHNELPYDPYMALYHDFNTPFDCPCPGDSTATQVGESDEGCDGIPDTGAGGFFGDFIVFPGECWLIRVGGWAMSEPATSRGPVILGTFCEESACFPSSTPVNPTVVDEVTLAAGQNTATTGDSVKNRFISVTGGDAGKLQAIRVRAVNLPPPYDIWNGMDLWVDSVTEKCENAGSVDQPCPPAAGLPKATFWAATLTCDSTAALFDDWTTYDLPIHIYNEIIVPKGQYEVAFADDSCSLDLDSSYSDPPLSVTNPKWGDVLQNCGKDPCGAPDGVVGVATDVTGVLDKFKNLPGAPIKSRVDLAGIPPNDGELDLKIQIIDVTWCLNAFVGGQYGFAPGDPCDGALAMGDE